MQPKKYALLMVLSLAATSVAHARGTIDKVDIKGLDKGDDAAIIENIQESLSLYDTIGKNRANRAGVPAVAGRAADPPGAGTVRVLPGDQGRGAARG